MTAVDDRPAVRMCKAGLHRLPEKGPCPECMRINAELHNRYWKRLAQSVAAPPHVTGNAVCDETTAHLFDPIEKDERAHRGQGRIDEPNAVPRIRKAQALCAGCPAAMWCYAFGVENDLVGVFGGTYLGRRG